MARGRSRTRPIGSGRHAMFFFIIYIVGATLLTFAKTITYPSSIANLIRPELIIILTSILLMMIYVLCVTIVPATKLRTDVAADNVYYLGFLYTLTSLAIALAIGDTDNILANFGVAIVSTLIGIVARVCLNQTRVDPTDIEEVSRLELADATRQVRAEMDETVRQFSDFRHLTLQILAEGYEEVNKNVELISANLLKSVEELAEQSSKQLNEFVEKTKSANEEAINSIGNVIKSNQELTQSHNAMVYQIKQVNSVLSTFVEHYADTGKIDAKIIGSVQEQLTNLQKQLNENTREGLSDLKKSIEETNQQSTALRAEFKNYILGTNHKASRSSGSKIAKPEEADEIRKNRKFRRWVWKRLSHLRANYLSR